MMTLGPVDYRKFGSVYSLAAFDLTTKLRINYGRERIIPKQKKQGVKIHRSVKVRMEADPTMVEGSEGKKYIPRAKWNVEPTWVDWLCSSKISDTMFSYSVMIRITNSKTFNPFFRLLKTLEHFRNLCPVGPPYRVFRLAFLFYWLQCRSRVLFTATSAALPPFRSSEKLLQSCWFDVVHAITWACMIFPGCPLISRLASICKRRYHLYMLAGHRTFDQIPLPARSKHVVHQSRAPTRSRRFYGICMEDLRRPS